MTGCSFAAPTSMVVALLLLGGCTTSKTITAENINPVQYAAVAEGLKGSPAIRRAEIQKCIAQVRATPAERATVARLMNLPANRDPAPVFCQRTVGAVASGRITYDDFQEIRANRTTPKLIRVIQNR